MIKLMGLWENKDKNGNTYFSGTLGGAKVLVFKNIHKETANQPDYIVNLGEKKREEKKDQEGESDVIPF